MSPCPTDSKQATPGYRGVYLITMPRSASNMFQTMMEKQPNHQASSYHFLPQGRDTMLAVAKARLSDTPEDELKALYDAYRGSWESMQDELQDAQEKGKQVFVKEHIHFISGPTNFFARAHNEQPNPEPLRLRDRNAPDSPHTNPTMMPDSLLYSLDPIFQIRHPVLMFPSTLRTSKKVVGELRPTDPDQVATLTLRHVVELFNWYRDQGVRPQVLDADDIMNNRAAVAHVCKETGMDPNAVQYEWETRTEKDPMKAIFLTTIYASTGILPGMEARGLDFETEKAKWKAEFGEEDGEVLARSIVDAMPDYEYLLSQRTYLSLKEGQEA